MNLEKERWLYFRTTGDEDDDDGDTASAGTSPTSLCVPAKNLLSIHPASDTSVQLNFKSVRNSHDFHADLYSVDTVVLNTDQGKTFEVMNTILQNINAGPHHDGFVVVADDVTTNYANATVTAQYVDGNINSCGAIFCKAANTSVGRLPSLGMGAVAPTGLSATELSVNTAYVGATATGLAMTIPSAAAGKAGDWITVLYTTAIANSTEHTFTTTTDTAYSLGSVAIRSGGSAAGKADVSVAADNVLTITGATNGDGGIGTYLKFVNLTGDTNGWAVEAVTRSSGNGTTAGALAFS